MSNQNPKSETIRILDSVNREMEVPITWVATPNDGLPHAILAVICDYGHLVGQWLDEITEKYPFYCEECEDDLRKDKYPWQLLSRIVMPDGQIPPETAPGPEEARE